jgi:hypothetical protein
MAKAIITDVFYLRDKSRSKKPACYIHPLILIGFEINLLPFLLLQWSRAGVGG